MQAAQLIHAAGQSTSKRVPEGTFAVALHARDLSELLQIATALKQAKIEYALIVESDAPYTGQAMAIGIEPGDRSKLKKILSRLPLVKGVSK